MSKKDNPDQQDNSVPQADDMADVINNDAAVAGISTGDGLSLLTEENDLLLRERADRLAHEKSGLQSSDDNLLSYVCFRLGETEQYGIDHQYADEIIHVSAIASVPCTPAIIVGVINRRGMLLPVLDLKEFFHTGKIELTPNSRIVIVSDGAIKVGLLVDEVLGNGEYKSSELAPGLPSDGVADLKYVQGIYNGHVTLLNMSALLGDDSIIVNESVG